MKTYQERQPAVYAFRKNSREEVRASHSVFKGVAYVDLRVFVQYPDGSAVATAKGLTLSRELLPELLRAVEALGDG